MKFNEAQSFLDTGSRIARAGWNGKGMYIARATQVVIPNAGPIADFYYITAGERRNTWVPSSADLIASDWEVVSTNHSLTDES